MCSEAWAGQSGPVIFSVSASAICDSSLSDHTEQQPQVPEHQRWQEDLRPPPVLSALPTRLVQGAQVVSVAVAAALCGHILQ